MAGRNPTPPELKLDHRITVQARSTQIAAWYRAARQEGEKLPEWVRKHLDRAAAVHQQSRQITSRHLPRGPGSA